MVTYEDITDMFLNAIEETGLSVHPEFWLNTQSLEREFSCTVHPGPCEESEHRAACTLSFAWAPLDTVLSYDGAEGICEFFHEPDEDCPHLHTEDVPPLTLDLTYMLPLERAHLSEKSLRQLARGLKLRASEHSSRAIETRSSVALALGESSMELPLWDPEGVSGYRAPGERRDIHALGRPRRRGAPGDEPHPEEWLPHLFAEVADDIAGVLTAMEQSRSLGSISGGEDAPSNN
jgi:hypothetical protein